MSKPAQEFVDRWISGNLEAIGEDAETDAATANKLALECLAAADEAGIDRTAIENECGDLTAYIDAAIARANAQRAERLIGRVRDDPSA